MKRISILGILSLGLAVLAVTPARAAAPYIIRKGDNLHGIAAAHNVEIERILYENPSIARPDKIYAGDTIEIPEDGSSVAGYEPYTVEKGDCLYGIAAAKGVPVASIMRLTPGLDNPSLLHVGQTLYIPATTGDTYTVEKGETLAGISSKTGVGLDELVQANPGIDPDRIDVDEKIQLPGATPGTDGQDTASPDQSTADGQQGTDSHESGGTDGQQDAGSDDLTDTDGQSDMASPVPTDTDIQQDAASPTPTVAQPNATATQAGEQSDGATQTPSVGADATSSGDLSLAPDAAPSDMPSSTPSFTEAVPTRPGTDVAAGDVADQPVIDDVSAMENDVFLLLNIERERAGIAALGYDDIIAGLARGKSANMAENGYLSHTSPQLGSPFKMLRDNGINYTTASENIARGQRTAEEVVDAWMDSTGHRESMMNPNFSRVGVGFAQDEKGRTYWTMLLIK